jgi:hypothetical protein
MDLTWMNDIRIEFALTSSLQTEMHLTLGRKEEKT